MTSALSSSAKGVSFLILSQLCSKAATFVVNQLLLGYITPELFGISIRLELYSATVLYFARESLRVALQRQSSNTQAIVNLGYVPIILGLPLSAGLGWRYSISDLPGVPHLREAIVLYGVSAMIELISEPCFVVVQQKMTYGIRAAADTCASIVRCLVTFGFVVRFAGQDQDPDALPFAYGQVAGTLALTITYFACVLSLSRKDSISLVPRALTFVDQSDFLFSRFSISLCLLSMNLYVQSGIKYLLTEGDSILIGTFASLQVQGIYGLASNYGGLLARIVFAPIEESSRNLFAKLCSHTPEGKVEELQHSSNQARPQNRNTKQSSEETWSGATSKSFIPNTKPNDVDRARIVLTSILRLYMLLALVCISLGPHIAPQLLRLVAGERWISTGAGSVLAAYTYYIPLLAMNGVSEAFVAAVATNAELRQQSIAMAVYFVLFASAVYTFLRIVNMGGEGLVWANCLNMACRIVWNTWFIRNYFGRKKLSFDLIHMLPTASSIASSAICIALLRTGSPFAQLPGSATVNGILWSSAVAALLGAGLLMSERQVFIRLYQVVQEA